MTLSRAQERLMNDIRVRLPGALDNAIKQELFSTLDEFLQGTNIWQENITIRTTLTGKNYEIEPEDNRAAIVRLIGVVNSDEFPVYATLNGPEEMILRDEPGAAVDYVATVVLTVVDPVNTDKFPEVPDWILVNYRSALLDGVLGRLMSQPAKPYSSERYAVYHGRRFRAALTRGKLEGRHQYTFGSQRWRFPQSFASVRR